LFEAIYWTSRSRGVTSSQRFQRTAKFSLPFRFNVPKESYPTGIYYEAMFDVRKLERLSWRRWELTNKETSYTALP